MVLPAIGPILARMAGVSAKKAAQVASKGMKATGQEAVHSFNSAFQSGLVRTFNADRIGKVMYNGLEKGLKNALYGISRKRSSEMWGRSSAAMLWGGAGARATAAGNYLRQYGGSAEEYNRMMLSMQSKMTALKFGQAGWLKEAMMKSGGLLNVYGSGENGFATQEELIENLAKIKDEIPVGQFRDVANALGVTESVQKAILDNNLDFIKKRNYLTQNEEKDMKEYGRSQMRTAAAMEKASQLWGAKTVLWWNSWEKFKGSIVEGWANFLTKNTSQDDVSLNGDTEKERVDKLLADPFKAGRYTDEYKGKDQELLEGVARAGYSGKAIRAYANAVGIDYAQASANARTFEDNGNRFEGNAFIETGDEVSGRNLKSIDESQKRALKGAMADSVDLENKIDENESRRKDVSDALDLVRKGVRLDTPQHESLLKDLYTGWSTTVIGKGGRSQSIITKSPDELYGGTDRDTVLKNLMSAQKSLDSSHEQLILRKRRKEEILNPSPSDLSALAKIHELLNPVSATPHDATAYDVGAASGRTEKPDMSSDGGLRRNQVDVEREFLSRQQRTIAPSVSVNIYGDVKDRQTVDAISNGAAKGTEIGVRRAEQAESNAALATVK